MGVGSSPVSVAIGDFNGDGKQDLAATNEFQTQSPSAWEMGLAGLVAQRLSAVGSFPWHIAIGDFNGDGKQDLAVAN